MELLFVIFCSFLRLLVEPYRLCFFEQFCSLVDLFLLRINIRVGLDYSNSFCWFEIRIYRYFSRIIFFFSRFFLFLKTLDKVCPTHY